MLHPSKKRTSYTLYTVQTAASPTTFTPNINTNPKGAHINSCFTLPKKASPILCTMSRRLHLLPHSHQILTLTQKELTLTRVSPFQKMHLLLHCQKNIKFTRSKWLQLQVCGGGLRQLCRLCPLSLQLPQVTTRYWRP